MKRESHDFSRWSVNDQLNGVGYFYIDYNYMVHLSLNRGPCEPRPLPVGYLEFDLTRNVINDKVLELDELVEELSNIAEGVKS